MKTLATYHKDCIDGTSAAAVVLKKFPDAQLFPLSHAYTTEDLAPVLEAVDADTQVFTVDCGLGAREILEQGIPVVTLDHHVGGKQHFEAIAEEFPNYTFIFDNDKSGASLAWSYFFPEAELLAHLKFVEDLDLWNWQYGDETKHVNNYLSLFVNDPTAMLDVFETQSLAVVLEKGQPISKYIDAEVERFIERPAVTLSVNDWLVPMFNITSHQSMCGNILSERLGQAVGMFTIKGDRVSMGFRSQEAQSPTSLEIAKALNGGGHVNAAGASMTLSDFLARLQ